ncbi:MFS general substrate transporter [Fistulina hepatica ATCC 64428]|uniref:MFS general substrate transporter n=1 Tax=Fistulina hepatica ATCC 64428 TaxID=1128425 RepID=A0A0D7A266_9AGAR|nr:MFS general substrate transporter [Fistulina hepatica ATCC 64428]
MTVPYFIRNLIPRKEKAQSARPLLVALREITPIQWALFCSGWLAWTCDAIDFFSVSLSVSSLASDFNEDVSNVTTAITLTLLLRPVGAAIFGLISDRFGRKWPLIVNLLIVAVLQLGAGFVKSFSAFLGIRSLFGIGMGGIWGLAASTALENLPVETRGLASGVLQQGYAVGYLLAACINLKLVPATSPGWRTLFWTASGISAFAAAVRVMLPESDIFLRARRAAAARGHVTENKGRIFIREARQVLKLHWLLCIYAVLFMTGFNFLSHGSQDLYPTYLEKSKGFSSHQATVATIIGNCGAIVGGAIAGWASQYMGRRLTIIVFILITGAFIPLWIFPSSFSSLSAGAFCVQFGVQGAWGVVPIQLAEMSPPAFRATFPGLTYQLGNMVSSASSQIEATGGDHLKTTIIEDGKETVVPNYATVQGILIGSVAVFLLIVTVIGPENLGAHFERHKAAFEEGAGQDDAIADDVQVAEAGPSDIEKGASTPRSIREDDIQEKESLHVGENPVS